MPARVARQIATRGRPCDSELVSVRADRHPRRERSSAPAVSRLRSSDDEWAVRGIGDGHLCGCCPSSGDWGRIHRQSKGA